MSLRKYCAVCLLTLLSTPLCFGQQKIEFTEEDLPNGLHVIYAPLHQAPVVHVRVLYHVGSRDERPDRQGFAHMFEHMMFRGSAHVKPEEHMKLIGMVGGTSNAFTSFDQTVYHQTLPANQLEMALYLEADRMASFKVSEEIYDIERSVVAEEWRMRQNAVYGTFFEQFHKLVFQKHPYQWTPIGNMDHLKAARAPELQRFFDRYYVPNNAVMAIAGDIDVAAAKSLVNKYFAWIPAGAKIERQIPAEPLQTQERRLEMAAPVPLTRIAIGWQVPPYRSDDHYAMSLLANILGTGHSSRLDRLLVNNSEPLCVNVGAGDMALEDGGYFMVSAMVMRGKDPAKVEQLLRSAVAELAENPVAEEELARARTHERVDLVHVRETAEKVASILGYEAMFAGDASRVNRTMDVLAKITPADVQAMARKYLTAGGSSLMKMSPGEGAAPAASQPVAVERAALGRDVGREQQTAAGGDTLHPARKIEFPADYPAKPPVADSQLRAAFQKGEETTINGVKVIVMGDHRLPYVSWGLTMRSGSHGEPAGKEGVASLTADLMRRGAGGLTYDQLNEDLESRGISIAVNDGGDYTRLSGSCLTEQVEHAMGRLRDVLLTPSFPADEFAKLKQQTLSSLQLAQARPETAASQNLGKAIFGNGPLGRYATPASVGGITLDDIKACYARVYHPNDAILVIAGDVTLERGRELAGKLLDGWKAAPAANVDYRLPAQTDKLRIILVDRPEGKQSMIRFGARAYDLKAEEKFAGSLASSILSSGLDSRLARYVRAEKGLVYSVYGVFMPGRRGPVRRRRRHESGYDGRDDRGDLQGAGRHRAGWRERDGAERRQAAVGGLDGAGNADDGPAGAVSRGGAAQRLSHRLLGSICRADQRCAGTRRGRGGREILRQGPDDGGGGRAGRRGQGAVGEAGERGSGGDAGEVRRSCQWSVVRGQWSGPWSGGQWI